MQYKMSATSEQVVPTPDIVAKDKTDLASFVISIEALNAKEATLNTNIGSGYVSGGYLLILCSIAFISAVFSKTLSLGIGSAIVGGVSVPLLWVLFVKNIETEISKGKKQKVELQAKIDAIQERMQTYPQLYV